MVQIKRCETASHGSGAGRALGPISYRRRVTPQRRGRVDSPNTTSSSSSVTRAAGAKGQGKGRSRSAAAVERRVLKGIAKCWEQHLHQEDNVVPQALKLLFALRRSAFCPFACCGRIGSAGTSTQGWVGLGRLNPKRKSLHSKLSSVPQVLKLLFALRRFAFCPFACCGRIGSAGTSTHLSHLCSSEIKIHQVSAGICQFRKEVMRSTT